MTTGYDPYTPVAAPSMGEHWDPEAGDGRPHRVGHPRPARHGGPYLVSGASDSSYPVVASSVTGPPRRSVAGLLALLLVLALGGIVGWQAYQLNRLGNQLITTDRQLVDTVAADRDRAADVAARTAALEKQAGLAFNPEAISSAALPSVFRVRAGDFTGTAFAIGGKAPDGKANLLTNYHVIASVWEANGKDVSLERGSAQVTARIMKADKDKDLALLQVGKKLTGLSAAGVAVKAGQPIVVVGAPLGLEDSVTTGVVSAFRQEAAAGGATIQFDAPINPGNSGGPVINSAKQVVGLATAKARDAEGIGLAIPIKTACDLFDNVC
jgi:putative serine protease PepD